MRCQSQQQSPCYTPLRAGLSTRLSPLFGSLCRYSAPDPSERPRFFNDRPGDGAPSPAGEHAEPPAYRRAWRPLQQRLPQYSACSPARSALLTGMEPNQTGVLTNVDAGSLGKPLHADMPNIGGVLRRAGYCRGYFGKWHLGDEAGDLRAYGFEVRAAARMMPQSREQRSGSRRKLPPGWPGRRCSIHMTSTISPASARQGRALESGHLPPAFGTFAISPPNSRPARNPDQGGRRALNRVEHRTKAGQVPICPLWRSVAHRVTMRLMRQIVATVLLAVAGTAKAFAQSRVTLDELLGILDIHVFRVRVPTDPAPVWSIEVLKTQGIKPTRKRSTQLSRNTKLLAFRDAGSDQLEFTPSRCSWLKQRTTRPL